MPELEIEGKTVEEAIGEGLKKLGCAKEDVEIKILNEGSNGLFGLMGSKPARVRLVKKSGRSTANIDISEAKEFVKATVEKLLKNMGFDCGGVTVSADGDQVTAEINTKDSALLIGKNGQSLDAFEYITNLIVNRNEKTRVKVSVDTENYRKKQEEKLAGLAKNAAEQVARTKKVFRFDPMSAKDRRILHISLKDSPGVETFSEGEGAFRRVGVKPKITK